jgi:hypothetical protein
VTVTYATKTSGAEAEDATYGATLPTDVGEYYAKFSLPATTNYNDLTAYATFEITKAEVSYTAPQLATELTADGSELSLITEGTIPEDLTGKTDGDNDTVHFVYAVSDTKPTNETETTTDVPRPRILAAMWFGTRSLVTPITTIRIGSVSAVTTAR